MILFISETSCFTTYKDIKTKKKILALIIMAQNINELIFYFLIIKIIQRILHLTLTINR